MEDKTLIKICLAWSLLGTFLLLILAEYTEPKVINVIELADHYDETVAIQGWIERATYKEEVAFFTLKDNTSKITVVVFGGMNETVHKGDEVKIAGTVSQYQGKLEVIADAIECVRCVVPET